MSLALLAKSDTTAEHCPAGTGARILIVDDSSANVRLIRRLLHQAQYRHVEAVTDPRRARARFADFAPDLVILDLLMPELDGFEVMKQLESATPPAEYLPIIVMTADASHQAKRRALVMGAKDFVAKPVDPTELLLRIKNHLETRSLHHQLQQQNARLEEEVARRTERLLQTEKLATMGGLLAGVAHEINNPLAVIAGQAALLDRTAPSDAVRDRASKIGAAADRAARIVKNFLSLARQHPLSRELVQVERVVEETVSILAYQLRTDSVEVVTSFGEALPPLWADPHRLQQVLINLVTNAQHALRETRGPRRIAIDVRADASQSHVVLDVADTGPGMPPEVRRRVFEPFFTTKPVGQGTGLGLSLCKAMLEEHGGSIDLETAPGRGTRFRIVLPTGTPGAPASKHGGDTVPGARRLRLLVVDDEPDVGEAQADLLALEGHDAEAVGSGVRALERIRAERYDAIFSDMRMPGIDGPALYREVRARWPELAGAFVFITGGGWSAESLDPTGRPPLGFLVKPPSKEDLRDVLNRIVLASGAHAEARNS